MSSKLANSKRYPWIVVALLWLVALLNYMDRQMLATMRPSMQLDIEELNSAENFGILMAIFLWIYAFMSPLAGFIADRVNRKWLIVISLLVWSAVTFAMGFSTSFDTLYWLRALMGVSEALYIPAGLSLIADYHAPKTRSLAVGIHMTGLYMGQALGGFGATIAAELSWQFTFQSFGLIGILYALVLVFFLREKPGTVSGKTELPNFTGLFHHLLRNPAFWMLVLLFTIPSLPGWAVKNWLPTLFAESLSIDMAVAGPLATITTSGSSLLGVLIGGRLSDKWVVKHPRGRVWVSAIGLALTVPALVLIGYGSLLWQVVLAAFLFGFGFGLFDTNNMPLLCQLVPPRYRATGYGLMNMMGICAGALITNQLGKSSDQGQLGSSFAMLSGIVLLVVILQLIFLRPKTTDYGNNG